MIRNLDLILEDFELALERHIDGGTTEYPMEAEWVEEQGIMSAEEYNFHEEALCLFFDNRWFQCAQCGWTLPIESMADNDNWECEDCDES